MEKNRFQFHLITWTEGKQYCLGTEKQRRMLAKREVLSFTACLGQSGEKDLPTAYVSVQTQLEVLSGVIKSVLLLNMQLWLRRKMILPPAF